MCQRGANVEGWPPLGVIGVGDREALTKLVGFGRILIGPVKAGG